LSQLRLSPSGPFIRGSVPGQALVWTGTEWVPALVPSSEDARVVPFTFSSGILALEPLFGGETLYRADLLFETPFDDPLATVTFGTATSPSLVLGPTDSDPTVSDQYESLGLFPFTAPDTLLLTVTPAGATMGSGILLYELRR